MNENSLRGLNILVPRPRPQSQTIATLIEAHGGTAILFPVIEITAPDNFTSLDQALTQLSEVDLIILVSVAAVNGLVARQRALSITLPERVKVAAVGAKTAAQCQSLGIRVDFVPGQRINSEGLLECIDGFSIKDKKIVIFRGQSGRDLLKTALQKSGGKVRYAESYRRRTTSQSIQPIIKKWQRGDINVVLITSVSILESLIALLGKSNFRLLKETRIITISHRIASACTQAGIDHVVVADSPTDDSVLEMLKFISS